MTEPDHYTSRSGGTLPAWSPAGCRLSQGPFEYGRASGQKKPGSPTYIIRKTWEEAIAINHLDMGISLVNQFVLLKCLGCGCGEQG